MAVGLICPLCHVSCFRFLYGCEHDGPCYFPRLGKFDAEAYAHRMDHVKNSPEFQRMMEHVDWEKVFSK
jgi:hypothetical protein